MHDFRRILKKDLLKLGFKYKMSVIIPVYNCENYINTCFESLKNQTMDFKDIQIVFVNDGSTDKSDDICSELSENNSNVTYFLKENGGVSTARNKGIDLAEGKYIMFLDCDDTVSSNSLLDIYNFFEENFDNTDVVTYSIDYLSENGEVSTHKRFNILTHTGIYDLTVDSNILQTTMNICIKNADKSERIYFDEELTLGEDQFFIFSWLMKKKKLGFVKEAVYTYFRHSGSASSSFNNPYYCFDQFIHFLDRLVSFNYEKNHFVEPIAQAMIVYNYGWRITSDMLVSHINPEIEKEQLQKVSSYLKYVDNGIICNSIYIDDYHIEYFMRLKGEKYNVMINKNTYTINDGKNLWFSQPLLIVFDTFKIKKNTLIFSGYTKNSVLTYKDIKLFYYDIGNNRVYVDLSESNFSYYKSKSLTNSFGRFECKAELSKKNVFFFHIEIDDKVITPALYFSYKCAVTREKNIVRCSNYKVNYDNESRCLFVDRADKSTLDETLKITDGIVYNYSKAAFIYRVIAEKFGNKNEIWLYSDREGILDNGYKQFIHDFDKKDGIKRFYIVDGKLDIGKNFSIKQRKHLVKFKSLKHKILFLNCSKILTSFNSISIISPFDAVPLKWYSDLTDYEVVYLQHGILHARLPLLYTKEKANADKIVISSEFEKKNFTSIYHFSQDDLIMSGMPRFDDIDTRKKAKNKILFSPSWRQNLIGEYINNKRELNVEAFLKSSFYNEINRFLNSDELNSLLEKYDLELDYKNHPIFRDYDYLFSSKSKRVHITQDKGDFQDYLAMITDYSSIVFDFVYINRPVLYFVPDLEQFKAGITHSYSYLDLPLEEGFGDIAVNCEELIKNLSELAFNKFIPNEVYSKRMNDFFSSRDKNNCERLYKALIENK